MRAAKVLLILAGLVLMFLILSSVRLSQEQVLVLLALAVVVLVLRARRQIQAVPALLKIRRVANANLTGARVRWGPYWRRRHLKAITLINGSIVVLFAFAIAPIVGPLLAASLLAWGTMSTLFRSFGEWYDDLLWLSRTIKFWGVDPVPWNGNHHVWVRETGKVVETLPTSGEPPAVTFTEPRHSTRFLVAHESPPDRWWGKEPDDGYFFVFPVRKDADAMADDGIAKVGGGKWDGYQYMVTGVWKGYLLGGGHAEDIVEYLPAKQAELVDGLDEDLREFIYDQWSDAKWWAGVLWIEMPGDAPVNPKAPDPTTLAALQDARVQIRQLRRDAAKESKHHTRQLNRITGK